jgi:C4-dicarboxylate transporter DctM subunit
MWIVWLLFTALVFFLVFGTPIGVSMGASCIITMLASGSVRSFPVLPQKMFTAIDSFPFMAIPLFILAGTLMEQCGISFRIVKFMKMLLRKVPAASPCITTVAATFFGAISGSAPATVIAIGSTIYPEIVKFGYPKARSAGLLAVAGGLGPIIPPSIIMVVYGTITNCSITNLFSAGIVAGTMIIVTLALICGIYSRREAWPKNEGRITMGEFLKSTFMAIPALMLPVIILGGIYSGYLTPTESASVSVIYAFFVGVFLYRAIPFREVGPIIVSSAKSSAMILFIIATSTAFSWVFTMSGISRALVSAIVALKLSPLAFSLAIAVILLIFGTFLEGIAICVLLVPVLWPIAQNLGLGNVHFGMIVCISNVIGTMTPPVAVNLFAASSVSGLKIGEIAWGELPFFIGYTAVFFLFVIFPWFSTFFL